jgi:hypothetical protein
MSADSTSGSASASLSHHPAPHRERASTLASTFGLLGGPLAWFVQLCAGYGLASWSCFPKDQRGIAPLAGASWSWSVMVSLLTASVVIAVASLFAARSNFARTRQEGAGDHVHLMEVGVGRTRFIALWGMLLGGGFAVATLLDAVAFLVLPRCAG